MCAGRAVEATLQGGDNVLVAEVEALKAHTGASVANAKGVAGLAVKVPPACTSYALDMAAFDAEVVGAKSRNTLALHDSLGGACPHCFRKSRSCGCVQST